jgi:hypothetical protein
MAMEMERESMTDHIQKHYFIIVQSLISVGLQEALNYCKREGFQISEQELMQLFKTAIETMKKDHEMNIEGLKP